LILRHKYIVYFTYFKVFTLHFWSFSFYTFGDFHFTLLEIFILHFWRFSFYTFRAFHFTLLELFILHFWSFSFYIFGAFHFTFLELFTLHFWSFSFYIFGAFHFTLLELETKPHACITVKPSSIRSQSPTRIYYAFQVTEFIKIMMYSMINLSYPISFLFHQPNYGYSRG
jgi:hypothetical protein